ncbi:MAG TPA: dephospho-CoA kinase [Anaerolineales bacterium]|nr:dephospho-CoA kinase [Anaerolineales bacterium]
MSRWPGKFVIGLTGNIAAGKSVVRRMLEHQGAYGIDADALGHRAMAKGAPGYEPVVDYFGKWILDETGQVVRARLGKIVFTVPGEMARLETILHPLVRQAIDVLVRRVRQPVIVIEAIKLLEGGLHKACDSIWVVHAGPDVRRQRLIEKREMDEVEARTRIDSQGDPQQKLAAADIVIRNGGSFENTWRQVLAAWKTAVPASEFLADISDETEPGVLTVQRARPSQAGQIARLVTRVTTGNRSMTRGDVMAAFGEKAFLLLSRGARPVGLLGYQVENLVTRSTDFYLEPGTSLAEAASALVKQVEAASAELQSEASLLFLPAEIAAHHHVWHALGYEKRSLETISVRAWQEAARESYVDGSELYFKQLRVDRVLRPI